MFPSFQKRDLNYKYNIQKATNIRRRLTQRAEHLKPPTTELLIQAVHDITATEKTG